MNTFLEKNQKILFLLTVLLGLFLLASTIKTVREGRFVGSGINPTNTITVTGEGKVEETPDTAKVSFTVRSEAKDLKGAQSTVSEKIQMISDALKAIGIDEKYIKTENYNSYPQYEYQPISCYGMNCPPQGTPRIRGYEVAHAVTVSVKNLDLVNDVLGVLGSKGVSDISGPHFGFEDDNAVARKARALAIADAKAEAKILAKALGVKLVRIVSFSDQGSSPIPMYARDMMASGEATKEMAPSIPVGDQNIESSVVIVYEIR